MAHSGRGHTWALVAGAVVTVACVAVAVATQWGKLPDYEWRFAGGWLALSLVIMFAVHVLNGEIWRGLLAELGGRLEPRRARAIWGTTVLARYVPTGALAVVGRAALAGREGVPRAVVIASTVYEVILALAAALLVGAYFVIVLPELAGEPVRWAVLVLAAATLAVAHPAVFERLSAFPLERLGRERLPRVLPTATVVRYLLAYVATLALAGVATYAFARSLHPVDSGDLPAVVSSYAVAFAISLLAVVLPGGLGAREAGMAAALSGALPFVVALAVAVGMRLGSILVEVVYAAAASALARGVSSAAAPGPAGDG
jgi:hypothetical protein